MNSDDGVRQKTGSTHGMADTVAYFDTGQREQIDENTTWHGSGWVTADGSLRIAAGPETTVWIGAGGGTKVYHEGQRAW